MKFQIMLEILFILLARRKVSAGDLARRFSVSVRTIYRYVDEMTIAGIPIDVARGPSGGIYISDTFKLPKGLMTKDEYARALQAMLAMDEQMGDPALKSAIQKLSAQMKSEKYDLTLSGNILVDSGTWGDANKFSEKLSLLEESIEKRFALDVDYISREGMRTQRRIFPHLLVYKQNIWYVYAFCTWRKAFRLFKLGRIRSMVRSEEVFERIPFKREDVPLKFWHDGEKTILARFEIFPEGMPFAEEWLGIENVQTVQGRNFAEVELPDDESLIGKILSVGAGIKVLEPKSLYEKVKREAEKIANEYAK